MKSFSYKILFIKSQCNFNFHFVVCKGTPPPWSTIIENLCR